MEMHHAIVCVCLTNYIIKCNLILIIIQIYYHFVVEKSCTRNRGSMYLNGIENRE